MKKIVLFISVLLIGFSSCSDDENNSSGEESLVDNHLKTGQIELKGYPEINKMSFRIQAKRLTIDWGDGTIEEITPNGAEMMFSHVYNNENYQTILIDSEGMTNFRVDSYGNIESNGYYFGKYYEFRVGNCTQLESITFKYNNLTVLDVTKCVALKELYCSWNQLTEIDLSKSVNLTNLNCSYNELSILDISKCTQLTSLNCNSNQLFDLNVSNLTLSSLNCDSNSLTKLTINNSNSLTYLYCSQNKLTELKIPTCPKLRRLTCYRNNLPSSELNAIFNSLPKINGEIWVSENPVDETYNESIATSKGWIFTYQSWWE